MRHLMSKLWKDDCGTLEAIEFLLAATILALGLIVGFTALRNAIVTEFEELANAILSISEGFSFGGLSGCCSQTDGSQAMDTPGLVTPHICTAPIPNVIDVTACP